MRPVRDVESLRMPFLAHREIIILRHPAGFQSHQIAWDSLAAERKDINDKRKAILEGLLAKHGIHREVFKMLMRYKGMDETQRRNFDLSFVTVREALGEPVQMDWLQQVNAEKNLRKMAAEAKRDAEKAAD